MKPLEPSPRPPSGKPAPAGSSSARKEAARRVLEDLLVVRAREGSREAFELLAARWQERLWRHAYRLTGRDDVAWDVVQESFLAVTRGISRLADPGAFRRWAYTIVTRTATDWLRRRGREGESASDALEELAVDETLVADRDEREQAVAELRAALALLPGDQRGLLSLRYLEGFELWELAEILEVPEGTVKSRLHHARNHMKDILERMERQRTER